MCNFASTLYSLCLCLSNTRDRLSVPVLWELGHVRHDQPLYGARRTSTCAVCVQCPGIQPRVPPACSTCSTHCRRSRPERYHAMKPVRRTHLVWNLNDLSVVGRQSGG